MGRAKVEAALQRVAIAGERLAARPASERIEWVGAALEVLRDPASDVRKRLVRELPGATGFSPGVVEHGLAMGLAPFSAESWRALAETELGPDADSHRPHRTTSVVLAGALPTPTVLQLLAPLALGSGVVAKPSAHDPVTPQVVHELLAGIHAELAAALELVHFTRDDAASSEALCQAECVVATGSDAAIAAIAARTPAGRHLVTSGHRFSVSVLGPEAHAGPALEAAAEAIALDVAIWDQLGCLSPIALFVLGVERVPDAVMQALAAAFERLEAASPAAAYR